MKKTILALMLGLSLMACNAFATSYEYSDAPGYEAAWHSTGKWQSLGSKWDKELSPLDLDSSDDGVSWSVNGGAYGNADLYVGQTVTFKFDIHKQNAGTHYADFLKAWIDWDNDNVFEETEVIAFDYQVLVDKTPADLRHPTSDEYADFKYDFSFFSDEIAITDSMVGDLWLRARVACSESLRKDWNEQWNTSEAWYNDNFMATGSYHQGEVEDWQVTVAPVPEPATMLLLGSGLVGLAFYRRRMKK